MKKDYDQHAIEVVNHLFKALFAIKPAFKASFESNSDLQYSKRQWMSAFKDAGITSVERIKRGLKKTRLKPSPFFPSTGEFIELCKPSPEDIGAPDLESAYSESCSQAHPQSWKKSWSHPAVKHAYQRTGNRNFLNENPEKLLKKFEAHYMQACLDFEAGKIMDQLPETPREYRAAPVICHDISQWKSGQVLAEYQHIRNSEECFGIIENMLGIGSERLKAVIKKLEASYTNCFVPD